MATKRVKRPKLERDRPRREWSTLFGAAPPPAGGPEAAERQRAPSSQNPLSDAVELGYRVIDDYLKQGQQAAQAFGGAAPRVGPNGAPPFGAADDLQQLAQRVMQYGWDFAGLWFEMWSRMGGPAAWPAAAPGFPGVPGTPAPAPAAGSGARSPHTALAVSVDSPLPTTTYVELQPGSYRELVIHALRPEEQQGEPIQQVKLEQGLPDGALTVHVKIDAAQQPGSYRAPIIDAATNLPVGYLSVRLQAKPR